MNKSNFFNIEKKANELRIKTLDTCINAGTGHVTSCMSCAEILAVLYNGGRLAHDPTLPNWRGRDRFILSKGQASPILYVALADRGFFPQDWLKKFVRGDDGQGKDAPFGVHLQCNVPGVEFTAGSLGCGLGYGAGMAEVAKLDGKNHKTFVLLGDGELYEGSGWEAALYAGHHKLNNLIAIVDRNKMCTNNYTEKIVSLEPLADRWKSYGWDVAEVDGHSVEELDNAIDYGISNKREEKPYVMIANTLKGRGIKSMAGKLYMHAVTPTGEAAEIARRELREFSEEHERNGGYNGKN